MKHVMVDLETLSLEPDAVILALGAVEFAPGRPDLSSFYRGIRVERQTAKWGRVSSPDTVAWWSAQSPAAQWAVFHDPDRVELDKALLDFTIWLGGYSAQIWGNGAAFDNVVLSQAYRATSLSKPWGFRDDRCYRTLRNLSPMLPEPDFIGTAHNALDDARHQAAIAARIMEVHKL